MTDARNNDGGRKRNSKDVIELLDDSDNDDDSVVEVVAAAKKKPRRETSDSDSKTISSKKPIAINPPRSSAADSTARLQTNGPSSLSFNVATYNVWFGRDGDPVHPKERMAALAKAVLARNTSNNPLWFIGFQEVTIELWDTLKPLLERAGYRVYCQDLAISAYGVALAVLQTPDNRGGRLRIIAGGWQPYSNSMMQRGFLHVRAQMPHSTQQQVLFTTTHLESYLGPQYKGNAERQVQIKELQTFCNHHQKRFPDLTLAFISGDLNWDDERVSSQGDNQNLCSVLLTASDSTCTSSGTWKDSWLDIREERKRAVAHPRTGKIKKADEPTCWTYDAKENPMLGGTLRRRFDRVLLRTKDGAIIKVKVKNVALIGKQPIEGISWSKPPNQNGQVKVVPVLPSDHYGYMATYNATLN